MGCEINLGLFPLYQLHRLMDVKQGQNKEGKTVLYLVFEYMDTDLKKFIRSFRQTGENIPPKIIKVLYLSIRIRIRILLLFFSLFRMDSYGHFI